MIVRELDFDTYLKELRVQIEALLPSVVQPLASPATLKDSMMYSLTAGGKRLRPLLIFSTLEAFGKDKMMGVEAACAVEMIHTYSLIHDDLPSMDNDDLRRGKPTNHKVFGEAMAILAGDALLTNSFDVLVSSTHPDVTDAMKVRLVSTLATCAGAEGMVGGQVADMEGEGQPLTLSELEYIHHHKTGKLLSFCVTAGAILAGATDFQIEKLQEFSSNLGLAFQIRDDILDIEGDEATLGKPIGSDTDNNKTTYPSLLGMEAAKQKLDDHIDRALQALEASEIYSDRLKELCLYVGKRQN
ncbi:polyprenyl synthetase family protein [Priestia koreensis]|uniref:polyprenyl synthetase family protein n=1 Tax=Priestia koreensis TaxID=284581 RepID=UPI001F563F0D|nr:farnesyl diphosphate synthase [Priestia koreensis]MCM3002419.1 polyprenyl synthetase family protein [Priestia koreensis]UNL84143.1 polyprenyl synthetase family protein [Priestia koreensis]